MAKHRFWAYAKALIYFLCPFTFFTLWSKHFWWIGAIGLAYGLLVTVCTVIYRSNE